VQKLIRLQGGFWNSVRPHAGQNFVNLQLKKAIRAVAGTTKMRMRTPMIGATKNAKSPAIPNANHGCHRRFVSRLARQ
jgi:hypothetical protein